MSGPVSDELVPELVAVVGQGDVAVAGEAAEGLVDSAVAEVDERLAFVVGALAAIGGEGDGVEPVGEGSEESAGIDLGELAVVVDGDDLGVGSVGLSNEAGELAGADHGGFVDDEHGAVVEAGSSGRDRASKRRDRARVNT